MSTVSETVVVEEKEEEGEAIKALTSEEVKDQHDKSDVAHEISIHQTIHIENHDHEIHNRYANDETASSNDINNISSSNINKTDKYEEANNSYDNEKEEEEAASRDGKMEERDGGANDKVITTTTATATASAASTAKEYILEDKVQALPISSSSNIESNKHPSIMSTQHPSINPLISSIKEPEFPSSVHKISPDFALALEEIQIPQPQKLSLTSEVNTFDFPIAAIENHIYSSSVALDLGLPVWNEESDDDDDVGNGKNVSNNNNKGAALTYEELQLPEELDIYYYSNDNPSDNPNEQSLSSKFRKGQKHKTKSPARASSVPRQVCTLFLFLFLILILLLFLFKHICICIIIE